jgi:TM2 domain-containing membrane protein YozV
MYKIIGADGREYGPVSADQLRRWIAEGRANAQSRVQPASSVEWKPLGEWPEFAVAAGTPPPINPPLIHAEFSVNSLHTPRLPGAEKKVAAGICGILLGGFGVHKFVLGYTSEGVTMLLVSLLSCGIGYAVMHVFGIVEGITYLTKPDEEFVATYITGKKGWF